MTKENWTKGEWLLVDGDRFEGERVVTTQKRLDESYGCICKMDVDFNGRHGV